MPKSYNVQKAFKKNNLSTITPESSSKTSSSSGSMTLKKKEKIKSVKNHQNINKKSIRKKLLQHGKKMKHLPLKKKQQN